MDPKDFCYWLQGFFELQEGSSVSITDHQARVIKDHLQLVFKKETPQYTMTINHPPAPPGKIPRTPTRYCSSQVLTEEYLETKTVVSC